MPTSPRPPQARRVTVLAWLTAALVLVLAACTGSGGGDAGSESFSDSGASVEDTGGEAAADPAAALAEGDEAAASVVDREIITTGHATVVADDPAAAAAELAHLVEEAGGRVERRSETAGTDEDPGSASLTVRLPADRMTSAVEALSGLGEVEDVQVDTEDVTGQAQDLDARIAALTTSTDRLRVLMGDAASTKDLLDVEQELSERQAELDSLTAQRQRLADQVAMSTLVVDLAAEPVAVAESRGGFLGGLASGWDALVTTASTVVLVLGVLLPWLALAALGYLGYRWWRRSREAGTPPPAEPATETAGG
ncbi:hypothetical protein GCM10009809_05050 [Isoptericola hypogeus]|uniref:DUF4349 domain-containing protein n=1 Tax=Isoptericola hypogeus TaxID=300179 RepID=A0ABP4UWW4_9MICO